MARLWALPGTVDSAADTVRARAASDAKNNITMRAPTAAPIVRPITTSCGALGAALIIMGRATTMPQNTVSRKSCESTELREFDVGRTDGIDHTSARPISISSAVAQRKIEHDAPAKEIIDLR
jgi:hypothetical protein